jgi:hypothetical protein
MAPAPRRKPALLALLAALAVATALTAGARAQAASDPVLVPAEGGARDGTDPATSTCACVDEGLNTKACADGVQVRGDSFGDCGDAAMLLWGTERKVLGQVHGF